jgi:hypothetical protein
MHIPVYTQYYTVSMLLVVDAVMYLINHSTVTHVMLLIINNHHERIENR